jgi:Zn-finger nucleic acid-binding protein
MEQVDMRIVMVDRCRACGGVWLDPSDLNVLLEQKSDALKPLYWKPDAPSTESAKGVCPCCDGEPQLAPMENPRVAEMMTDQCLTCFGMWFDAGELQRLKEKYGEPDEGAIDL